MKRKFSVFLILILVVSFCILTLLPQAKGQKGQEETKESMKYIKAKPKDLVSLFLKRVKAKDLPKRDPKAFKKEKAADMKIEEKFDKLQHEMEESEAPIINAWLKQAGMTSKEFMGTMKKKAEKSADFMERYREYYEFTHEGASIMPPGLVPLDDECETIEVRVCPEEVCVANPMPMFVDDIWLEDGSDGNFNKLSENSFIAHDGANGWSTWNLTYHRHSRTHSGKIIISFSTELVESAIVRGMGVRFAELPDEINGGCASGEVFVLVPNSWGHVKMYWKIRLRYKRPGETWVNWFTSAKIKYFDHWNEQHWLVPGVCGPLGHHNVLGQYGSYNLHVLRYNTFPAGTQFLGEVELSWWVKGNGESGVAGAHYDLNVNPYIEIEACSMEFPDEITIPLPDLP